MPRPSRPRRDVRNPSHARDTRGSREGPATPSQAYSPWCSPRQFEGGATQRGGSATQQHWSGKTPRPSQPRQPPSTDLPGRRGEPIGSDDVGMALRPTPDETSLTSDRARIPTCLWWRPKWPWRDTSWWQGNERSGWTRGNQGYQKECASVEFTWTPPGTPRLQASGRTAAPARFGRPG